MGFLFILPLALFLCFYSLFFEFFFLLSLTFLYFVLSGLDYEFSFFSFGYVNWFLLLLCIFVLSFMFLSNKSFSLSKSAGVIFCVFLVFMMISLMALFFSLDVLVFYVFYEFSIFPIFMLLSGWGFNFERLGASFYMMVYTLIFSLPFLGFLCILFLDLKTLSFSSISFVYYSDLDFLFSMFSLFMFFVKLPSFFFHLWLPKAHVEAPVSGSMILAGLLLKLGSYGILVFLPFLIYLLSDYFDWFFSWGLWGGAVSSILCFRQVDLKKMVAFMSVSHMSILMASLFTLTKVSFWAIILMMLSHGLTSSGLFYLLNCFYERFYSRSLYLVKGGMLLFSSVFLWFLLIVFSNFSVPPTLNFFSELALFFSISFLSLDLIYFMIVSMFLGTLCSLHIFLSMFHGQSFLSYNFSELSLSEHFVLFCHSFPIFVLFVSL